jgi:hypothetical protein
MSPIEEIREITSKITMRTYDPVVDGARINELIHLHFLNIYRGIDLDPIKKERLTDKKHYTDYKITYRCKDCGVLTEVPGCVKK